MVPVFDVAVRGANQEPGHQSSCFTGPFKIITKCCQIDVTKAAGFPFGQRLLATGVACSNIIELTDRSQGAVVETRFAIGGHVQNYGMENRFSEWGLYCELIEEAIVDLTRDVRAEVGIRVVAFAINEVEDVAVCPVLDRHAS